MAASRHFTTYLDGIDEGTTLVDPDRISRESGFHANPNYTPLWDHRHWAIESSWISIGNAIELADVRALRGPRPPPNP